MSMLENWREVAYGKDMNTKEGQLFWGNYFALEKGIYEKLLAEPETEVKDEDIVSLFPAVGGG